MNTRLNSILALGLVCLSFSSVSYSDDTQSVDCDQAVKLVFDAIRKTSLTGHSFLVGQILTGEPGADGTCYVGSGRYFINRDGDFRQTETGGFPAIYANRRYTAHTRDDADYKYFAYTDNRVFGCNASYNKKTISLHWDGGNSNREVTEGGSLKVKFLDYKATQIAQVEIRENRRSLTCVINK